MHASNVAPHAPRRGRFGGHVRTRAVLATLGVFMATAGAAQMVDDYRFRGRIVDTQGVPLDAVQVTFRNVETGARIVFKSKKDGSFDRHMIPHALYEVRFEKEGYSSRVENFDWRATAPETIVKETQVVLETRAGRAARAQGMQAARLYEEAYAALDAQDYVTARARAETLLAHGAGEREYAAHFVLARCHAQSGADSAAVAEYQRALARKPDLFEAHFDLGGIHERMGHHDSALAEFERAATLRPDDAEVHYNVGALLLGMQRADAAVPHLERALDIDSTHAPACKALGYAYLQGEHKDVAAAQRALERYLALHPQSADTAQVRELLKSLNALPVSRR